MPRIIQINLNRRPVAHDLLFAPAATERADILVVSEPNRAKPGGAWIEDLRRDASIRVLNEGLDKLNSGGGNGFEWIE